MTLQASYSPTDARFSDAATATSPQRLCPSRSLFLLPRRVLVPMHSWWTPWWARDDGTGGESATSARSKPLRIGRDSGAPCATRMPPCERAAALALGESHISPALSPFMEAVRDPASEVRGAAPRPRADRDQIRLGPCRFLRRRSHQWKRVANRTRSRPIRLARWASRSHASIMQQSCIVTVALLRGARSPLRRPARHRCTSSPARSGHHGE